MGRGFYACAISLQPSLCTTPPVGSTAPSRLSFGFEGLFSATVRRRKTLGSLAVPKMRALLPTLALAGAAFSVVAEPLVLAPGKSVTIVDATDPSTRVVITAPADEALDLDALFAAALTTGGLPSLVTQRQVKSAGEIVRHPDGSLSLGAPSSPATISARPIEGGVVVFGGGTYKL